MTLTLHVSSVFSSSKLDGTFKDVTYPKAPRGPVHYSKRIAKGELKMSKITRYNGNLKAFASEATGTERTIFGDTAQSDTLDANITFELLRGWG